MKNIFQTALVNALATGAYIAAVATFIFYIPKNLDQVKTPLIPTFMLLLLVFSAALTGFLVFGKPILWYLDGQKKEALLLLAHTLAILLLLTIVAFLLLFVIELH